MCTSAYGSAERYDRILKSRINPAPTKIENHTWFLTFEHEKLPVLDGTWILRKKTVKRGEIALKTPVSFIHCGSRLPFEEGQFEKEIVISAQGQDYFVLRALYIASNDALYQNFGLKGVLIPGEATYTYTLKLIDHLQNPSFVRQLYFNGKLIFENITSNKITGKGYEIEYTPECHGTVQNKIEFELVRKDVLPEEEEITSSELPSSEPLQGF